MLRFVELMPLQTVQNLQPCSLRHCLTSPGQPMTASSRYGGKISFLSQRLGKSADTKALSTVHAQTFKGCKALRSSAEAADLKRGGWVWRWGPTAGEIVVLGSEVTTNVNTSA